MSKIKFSKTKLEKIAKRYQIADIYLFGSKISGFERSGSDLDIGIRFKKGLPTARKIGKIYGNLYIDLSTIFPEGNIDLVFIEEVPLHFQFKIVSEGELVYSADLENTFTFVEKIVNYYRDYKFFIEEYFSGVLAREV